MTKKTTIPVSTGLLSPEHYKQIGPAIFTFLTLIDMVTEEFVEDGERWGKVLGGKPIEADTIAKRLGIHHETAKEHLRRLKTHEYIRARRTPRGESFDVRKSIKWLMRNHGASTTGPSNQQVIAELVKELRTIPGVVAQDRDHGVMGKLLDQHGPDKVTYHLTRLRQLANTGQINEPRAWLIGTLGKAGKVPTIPSASAEQAKRLAKADCLKCDGTGFLKYHFQGTAIPTQIPCQCWSHPTKT